MSSLADDHVRRLSRRLEAVEPLFPMHGVSQTSDLVTEAMPSWVLQVVLDAVAQEAMPEKQKVE